MSTVLIKLLCALFPSGETQYNRDKLLQGQGIDTPLSDTGHLQAAAAGRYLRDLHFTNVFASNLQRAVQGFGVAEGRPKEDLKNMANAAGQACRDYTPPGGETLEQVTTRFKKFLKSLYQRMLDDHCSSDPCSASSPGPSEPKSPIIAGLANDGVHGVPVHALIVSHGAFIRISVRHLVEDLQCSVPAGLKMSQVISRCPNTGICRFIITLSREKSSPRAIHIQCIFINRKDHLNEKL
ncbi:fructose-2,6-bisphosphatase TIGAR B isoform X3 [Myxocyprinus asiaticus]|uniref:fructose-2,6-bisphosphatase TIGAR B isoform X3 n=1 Tax=Myxocyprinus asiaticus TaxID=70543 RepID=UPI00222360A1|nr:fructose-2,6-bisphosphatase TIGAR B isoform X3 [Myxocyprinus asiaticus]